MPRYNQQDGARPALFQNCCVVLCSVCFVSFYVLFLCKYLLYYCHRVTTQLQLTDISYHIIFQQFVFKYCHQNLTFPYFTCSCDSFFTFHRNVTNLRKQLCRHRTIQYPTVSGLVSLRPYRSVLSSCYSCRFQEIKYYGLHHFSIRIALILSHFVNIVSEFRHWISCSYKHTGGVDVVFFCKENRLKMKDCTVQSGV